VPVVRASPHQQEPVLVSAAVALAPVQAAVALAPVLVPVAWCARAVGPPREAIPGSAVGPVPEVWL